ncbi:MAG TPA: molecular chaperone TorD family protein [Candidatus Sulfomarinibacteraceae bacterium]|nr:molecular chaperone TorD family protein [Candidatus Sulfomarinibacteraceae bacterium]
MTKIITERSKEQWAELLAGQYLLFGLLGKLFYNIPDAELLDTLVQDDVFDEAPFAATQAPAVEGLGLLREWSEAYAHSEEQGEMLADVKADHTRLFVVTEKLPLTPWESVYYSEERLLFQESTVDVRNWYAQFGLETVTGRSEPEDHIGLELAFVAHLAHRALMALDAGNEQAFQQLLAAQKGFCQKHLMVWAPLWCAQMVEYARTDFYRGLALLLRGALDELATIIEVPLREVALT